MWVYVGALNLGRAVLVANHQPGANMFPFFVAMRKYIKCMLYVCVVRKRATPANDIILLCFWSFGAVLGAECTLPETHSSPLKLGHPERKRLYSNHPSPGASCEFQ